MVWANRHSISSRIFSLVDLKLAAILLLIVFSASVPSAFAEFTTTNNAYACDSPSDGLNQIHRISKADSSIQSSNTMAIAGLPNDSRGCNGLAVDPTSLLYYVIVNVKGGDRYLATIDPETGLGTAIGSMGDNFATLAFKSDGTLYAIGGAGANSPNILQSVNKLTGETTELCEFPPNGPGHNFLGYNWEDETMYRLWGYGADGELFLDAISDEATCSTASSIPVNKLETSTLSIMNMAFHTNDHDFLFLARDDATGNTVYWELKINGDAKEKHDNKMPDGIDRKGFAFELENNSGTDTDLDTVADKDDNCVFVINPLQIDSDGDGLGDECDGTPTVAINADVTSGRTPFDVSFTCTSQTGNSPFGYSWDFENDTAIDSTMQNTTHTFTSAGVYDVKCTIDDSDNDSDSDYVTINAILPTGGEPDPELLLTINNPTPEKDDHFGTSVSSTLDGNLLVGAPGDNTGGDNAGSAYLFDGVTG
ncbi:MAG: PKD domain-containing protein, partial [Nitrosopumilus sp.]|nr:PKD domain-containing protein [Nitrosopumilus sp.]